MIVIKIKFEANRYNATPWQNNVNENIPEWPPSIYRLYRAIIDSWKRKYINSKDKIAKDNIMKIFEILTHVNPYYKIPEYTQSYTVSYMNVKTNTNLSKSDSALIYNPFIYIKDCLYIVFNVDIDNESREILNKVLSGINFLGRSESWVSISLTDEKIECNFIPSENGPFYVPVATKVDEKWLENMEKTTSDTVKSNLPKTMKIVRYDFINRIDTVHRNYEIKSSIKSVMYQLSTTSLPSIYDTIMISDKIHKLLLSKSIKFNVNNLEKFSGRNNDGTPLKGNRHMYILPIDLNNDGKIDHILLKGKENLNPEEIKVINNINLLYIKADEIRLTPIQYYASNNHLINKFRSKYWISETPVVFSRHYKKNKGTFYNWIYNELVREFKFHSIITEEDEIENVELIKSIEKNNRNYYWLNYKRSRKDDPERNGYGFKIVFKNKISGPFAIGYAAHYGLGLFMPAGDNNR